MKSLRQQLLQWLLLSIALGSTLIGILVYWNEKVEVDELYNAHLQQIATLLANQLRGTDLGKLNLPKSPPENSDSRWDEENYLIQIWDKHGVLYDSVSPVAYTAAAQVPLDAKVGFHRHHINGQSWRIYRADSDNFIVQIAQPEAARHATINEISLRILLPLLLQIPLLAALAWFAIRRGLLPLDGLSRAIAARKPGALTPIDTAQLPVDLQTLAGALNDLLARLDLALQQQRNFVADAAHELRTPITALQLQLDLLQRAKTTEDHALALAALNNGVRRSTALIQQLLLIARTETPQSTVAIDVALPPIATAIIEQHLPLARSRYIDLGVTQLDSVCVHGVAADIEAVFDNLLSNAIRYTPPGGKIDVAVYCTGGAAIVEVTDTGIGIPPDERTRIFDRFHRVLVAQSENVMSDGNGLGLAIVKSICDRYGAAISVETGPDGRGSCFRVHWPSI